MSNTFDLSIITPGKEHITYKTQVLTIESTDGGIQFLANHVPVILATIPCITKIKTEDGNQIEMFTSSGLIYFNDNEMKLICDAAEFKENIDLERATLAEERAKKRLESKEIDIDIDRAKMALIRSNMRIKFLNS